MGMSDRLDPESREELMHARARARNADRAASRLEAQAREARARARGAQQHYEDLILEHGGQMTIDDVLEET